MRGAGLFIVFEGGEGTGKTTQIEKLKTYIEEQGLVVLKTFEPGGTAISDQIRQLLLRPENKALHPRAEVLLYAASRAQHVEEKIRPALHKGVVVICDRYWDASRAYQGGARDLGIAIVDRINDYATQGLEPDIVFLFDLDGAIGLERARKRAESTAQLLDRMEQESSNFHQKVRSTYAYLAKHNPRIRVIDASQSIENVFSQIQEHIHTQVMELKKSHARN